VQTPDSAAVQRPRLPHRCLLPQSFAVLCFAVAVVFFAVAVVVAFSPLPAVAVVGFVVAVVCVCRCLFCRCLRLPLSFFAVILSAATDPDALHPPVPLEPFAHNRQPWQPASQTCVTIAHKKPVKPPNTQNTRQSRRFAWRSSSPPSAILDTEDKESPETCSGLSHLKIR